MPVKCGNVEHRCSTHLSERLPLSRESGFTFSALCRVAAVLYKTLLGESRRPVSLQVLKCPALSRSQQTLKSHINKFSELKRGLLCLK